MSRTKLTFKQGDEDGMLKDCIKTVSSFVDAYNTDIRVKLDADGECPVLTISKKQQTLSCSFDWYRKNGDFKVESCMFIFETGTLSTDIIFEFSWDTSGSGKWVQEYQEVQRLKQKLEELVIKSGLVKRLPSSYLKS